MSTVTDRLAALDRLPAPDLLALARERAGSDGTLEAVPARVRPARQILGVAAAIAIVGSVAFLAGRATGRAPSPEHGPVRIEWDATGELRLPGFSGDRQPVLTTSGRRLWAAEIGRPGVVVVEPSGSDVRLRRSYDSPDVAWLAADGGGVWVLGADGRLLRAAAGDDHLREVARLGDVGVSAQVAAAGGRAWVTAERQVIAVDERGRRRAVDVGVDVDRVVGCGSAVWALASASGEAVRIDTSDSSPSSRFLTGVVRDAACVGGELWTLQVGPASVGVVDRGTGRRRVVATVSDGADSVVGASGLVWVHDRRVLQGLDREGVARATIAEPVDSTATPQAPAALGTLAGSRDAIWVLDRRSSTLLRYRLGTR